MLFRETDEIVFCFDGDNAGKKAARRALESALPSLKSGRDARFMFLPDGEDPDSLVSQHGRDYFLNAIDSESLEASAFMFRELEAESGNSAGSAGTGHRARLAELCRPMIEKIPAGIYRDLVSGQLEEIVGATVFSEKPPSGIKRNNHRANHSEPSPTPMRRAISLLINHPNVALEVDPELYKFSPEIPGAKLLYDITRFVEFKGSEITTSMILEKYRDEKEWKTLNKLVISNASEVLPDEPQSLVEIFENIIILINREWDKEQKRREKEELLLGSPQSISEEKKEEIRRRFFTQKKK